MRNGRGLYYFSAIVILLMVLSACGFEYREPEVVSIEREPIQTAESRTVTIAEGVVTEEAGYDYFSDYREETTERAEESTNGERNDTGDDVQEGTGEESSGWDDSGLSDSAGDISDSVSVQEEAWGDDGGDTSDSVPTDGDSGDIIEPVYAEYGAEQVSVGDSASDEGTGSTEIESVLTEEPVSVAEETYVEEETLTYLGAYTISFYCNCEQCCGQFAWMNMTASGREPLPWYTVASGSDLPFGTRLYVSGFGYFEVMDRGVPSGWLDVYVNDHSEIPSYGITTADVYIVG